MKFVISTQELNYLINKCQAVISQKPPVQIVTNFLIEAANNELVITATDMVIAIRCRTDAKILEEGSICLPSRTFSSLIKELTAINVEVSTNENYVAQINADSSRFKLLGVDPSGFPHLPDLAGAQKLTMLQSELKEMLSRAAFTIAREDKRIEFTGLSFVVENSMLTFVGTDGKKLCRIFSPLTFDSSISYTCIIPLKTVEEMLKNLNDEGNVTLFLLADKIAMETESSLIVSKLISAEYPDVNQVIPQAIQTHVTLHREELMTLLRQVSLFRSDVNHSACFSFDQGSLTLMANTNAVGEGKVSMPVDWRASRLDIAFNPNVFFDVLRHCKQDVVTLGLVDAHNPGILSDTEEPSAPDPKSNPLYLVMPMRLMT